MERSILKAAAELLEEQGFRSFTIEEVALRAGVGKPSIYRRWPSKGTLALDALLSNYLQLLSPVDTGNLTSDLTATLMQWAQVVTGTKTGRSLIGLVAEAQTDRDLGVAWRTRFVMAARSNNRPIIERACARNEISSGVDVDVLLDMLYGAAYHRVLQHHLPLSDESIAAFVAVIVAGANVTEVGPR